VDKLMKEAWIVACESDGALAATVKTEAVTAIMHPPVFVGRMLVGGRLPEPRGAQNAGEIEDEPGEVAISLEGGVGLVPLPER
jgi:hypothetical protein